MSTLRGVTSLSSSGGSCRRLHRLRMAIATAFLAEDWPTMCRLSSVTTSVGRRDLVEKMASGGDSGWSEDSGGRFALFAGGISSGGAVSLVSLSPLSSSDVIEEKCTS